jgi:hypothetical protein
MQPPPAGVDDSSAVDDTTTLQAKARCQQRAANNIERSQSVVSIQYLPWSLRTPRPSPTRAFYSLRSLFAMPHPRDCGALAR